MRRSKRSVATFVANIMWFAILGGRESSYNIKQLIAVIIFFFNREWDSIGPLQLGWRDNIFAHVIA